MAAIEMVEGLVVLEAGDTRQNLIGNRFYLPPGFDFNSKSGNWVEDGPSVIEAQQSTAHVSAGVSSNGWAVWEDEKKKPCKRVVGGKTYILMWRPKSLQQAVNQIYAKESRDLINGELLGKTNNANPSGDPGVLTNEDLRRHLPSEREEAEILPSINLGKSPEEANQINLK